MLTKISKILSNEKIWRRQFTLVSIVIVSEIIFACSSPSHKASTNPVSEALFSSSDKGPPILAKNYVTVLGKGLNVDWSISKDGKDYYDTKEQIDYRVKGLSHMRIRIKERVRDANEDGIQDDPPSPPLETRLFKYVSTVTRKESGLDQQLKDSLEVGIIPIVAYHASEFENNFSDETINKVVEWWKIIAKRYVNTPYTVSYNLIIEVPGGLPKSNTVMLNKYYAKAIPAIRAIDPKRIIIVALANISDPFYLDKLELPTDDPYIIAEWHFYAAGPVKVQPNKKGTYRYWTTGTPAQKNRSQIK